MYWVVEAAAVLSLLLPAVLSAPTWEDTADVIFENGTDVDISVPTSQPQGMDADIFVSTSQPYGTDLDIFVSTSQPHGTDADIFVSTSQPPSSPVAVEETTTESSLFRRRVTRPVRTLSAAERTHKQRLSLGLSVLIAWIMYFAFLLIIKNYDFS
ncbi:hypothetical protein J6590_007146 [Homalodisca vitripennis]|nr:hypothetical protein J6590_007146 [Homalodisca vitripennis]